MSSRPCASTDICTPTDPAFSPYPALAAQVGALVTIKQAQYGNSFTVAPQILRLLYPDGIRPDQYDTLLSIVRVLDKLKRLATGYRGDTENPWLDIAGYSLLALHATQTVTRPGAAHKRASSQASQPGPSQRYPTPGALGRALALIASQESPMIHPQITRRTQIFFKKSTALSKIGRQIITLVAFSGVPKHTAGQVVRADKSNNGYTVVIQWTLPQRRTQPLVDWFTKNEYQQYLEEL